MNEKLRIIVVDDDRRMAMTLVDILKARGYRGEAAHSGAEALRKVEKEHFDGPEFAETLGGMLQERGFDVSRVTDPHGVVEELGSEGQVLLLDMKPKCTNGLEMLQDIRRRYPFLPVVLVTDWRLCLHVQAFSGRGATAGSS